MDNKPSAGVKVFGCLEIFGGISLLCVVAVQFFGQIASVGICFLNLIFAIAAFIIGLGLLKLRFWARALIMLQAMYGIIRAVIGIALRFSSPQIGRWIYSLIFSLFIIWFFTRKSVKEQFKSDIEIKPVLSRGKE